MCLWVLPILLLLRAWFRLPVVWGVPYTVSFYQGLWRLFCRVGGLVWAGRGNLQPGLATGLLNEGVEAVGGGSGWVVVNSYEILRFLRH